MKQFKKDKEDPRDSGHRNLFGCRRFLACCWGSDLSDKGKAEDDTLRFLGYISPKTFGLQEADIDFVDQGELVYLFERPTQIPNIRKYCLTTLMKLRP